MRSYISTLAVAALLGVAGAASAATVEQLIHFDDLAFNPNNFPQSNGAKDYTTIDGNFFVEPNKTGGFLDSGNCADSVYSGNGSCIGDNNKGEIATVTRLVGDFKFTLLSFYFNLLGEGSKKDGSNSVTATSGATSKTFTYNLVAPSGTSVVNYPAGSIVAGVLDHNVQYVADVSGVLGFKDITSLVFTSAGTANVRVDCIKVSYDDADGKFPTSDAATGLCGREAPPPPSEVPVPAAGLLLAGALGGLAAVRRRRKS